MPRSQPNSSAPGRHHRYHRTGRAGIKSGHVGHPHRFCVGDRPRRRRSDRKPGAAGRQCHRSVDAGNRSCQQACRFVARSRSQARRSGNPGQCRNPANPARDAARCETAAQKFNLKVVRLEVRRAEDLASRFRLSQRPRTGALRVHRSTHGLNRVEHQYAGVRRPAAGDLRRSRSRRGRRPDVLRRRLCRSIPSHRRLDRQNSARGKARRYPGRAADQVRFRHQSQDRRALGIDVPPTCSHSPTR